MGIGVGSPGPRLPSCGDGGVTCTLVGMRMWLVVALILVVAACSGDDSGATTTTTVAPTSSTTTTAAPAPTSTTTSTTTTTLAVPVTLAPSDPFVTTGGLGPIRVGMSVEEAEAAAGFALEGEPDPEISESCYHVTPPGGQEGYEGVSFMVVDDVISRVEVRDASTVTTRSGAGIGVNTAALEAMFPGRLEEAEVSAGGGVPGLQYVPVDEEDVQYRVVFLLDESGTVTEYRAGILPAVAFFEGCV